MNNCIDCRKILKNIYAYRCKSCSKKGKLNPNWDNGKPNCINCGKQIDYNNSFCKSCSKIGIKNPMFGKFFSKSSNDRNVLMLRYKYRKWRNYIFERDNWTCKLCGKRGYELEADHIKPWIDFPELRYDVNNGRTLCKKCHQGVTTIYLKNNWKNQFSSAKLFRAQAFS